MSLKLNYEAWGALLWKAVFCSFMFSDILCLFGGLFSVGTDTRRLPELCSDLDPDSETWSVTPVWSRARSQTGRTFIHTVILRELLWSDTWLVLNEMNSYESNSNHSCGSNLNYSWINLNHSYGLNLNYLYRLNLNHSDKLTSNQPTVSYLKHPYESNMNHSNESF